MRFGEQTLLAMTLGELMPRARTVHDEQFGSRVTFSPKVFIPLTTPCRFGNGCEAARG